VFLTISISTINEEKMSKRSQQEELPPTRWDSLFKTYATTAEKIQLDHLRSPEERHRFMRSVVLSELEKLAEHLRGQLLARILSYLPKAQLREVCRLSTTLYGVCKRFYLEERNVLFYNNKRIVTTGRVISAGVGATFCVWITQDGVAHIKKGERSEIQILIGSEEPFESVVASESHCLLITRTTRSVYGYGNNSAGQLGVGDTEPNQPLTVRKTLIDERVHKVVCVNNHSAVLTETGNVYTFGMGHELMQNELYVLVSIPRLLNRDLTIIIVDVSLWNFSVALLTEYGEILEYGEGVDGEVVYRNIRIDRIYHLNGERAIAWRDRRTQNVFKVETGKEIATNVKEFKTFGTFLRHDGSLVVKGALQNLPLPVKTFDFKFNGGLVYVFSEENFPSLSLQCVQCGQQAQHFAPDTYEPYCSLICKRSRDESDDTTPPMQRPRQGELNVLQPTTQVILENPRRLQEFAMQVSRDTISAISNTQDGSLYGQLNRNNMFWYWISKRFMQVGFNRLVNYKDIAGLLI
jgi:hypothetical protein